MIEYNRKGLRLLNKVDYWWGVILGAIVTLVIIIPIGLLFLNKLKFDFLTIPFIVLSIGIVVYYQWKDDNLKSVKTNFDKKKKLRNSN